MQTLILAGGKGTRLKSVIGDLPKPLVDICGTPLLGRQLELIKRCGGDRVIVLAGYGAAQIAEYCGGGSKWGLDLAVVEEDRPRGTAGAVLDVIDRLDPQFMLMYGDTVMDVDLRRLAAAHVAGSAGLLFVHPNDHPHDSDLVEVDLNGRVVRFLPYPHPEGAEFHNLVNAALYVLDRQALDALDGLPPAPDFGKHVFPRMLEMGVRLDAYRSPEYIKDAGSPQRIEKVRRDFAEGRVAAKALSTPCPAVFLDRDGVLNIEKSRISKPGDLELIPGVPQALARLNNSPLRTVVVTNQPVVARGDCSMEELDRIHARLDTLLGREGAYVDALYICPHHPDSGFAGEVAELKRICECRKPATGMVVRASEDLNIDIARSWIVGDTTSDIEMARRAGLRSILVRTGYGGQDTRYEVKPDYICEDLAEAVEIVLNSFSTAMHS